MPKPLLTPDQVTLLRSDNVVSGATPTLAPGAMVELGLLGLAYTYRHPALGSEGD